MRRSETGVAHSSRRAAAGPACDRFGCGNLGRLAFRQHVKSVERRLKENGGRFRPAHEPLSEIGHRARSKGGLRANRVW